MLHDDEFRDALRRALLEEAFGPIGLCGPRRVLPWLPALSASATRLMLVGDVEELDALRVFGGEDLGVELERLEPDASPPATPDLAGLVALDWPETEDPLRTLEAVMARVADRGLCVLDLPVDAAREARTLRLLEGMMTATELRRSQDGRLLARGLRDAPGRELEVEEPEPIDLTVLVYTRGSSEAANATTLDLLFRQNFPPHLVLVLDDAPEGETPVPDDLWGMAPHAQTQPGLLRTQGAGRAAALAQALPFVESEALAWVEAGDRLAANHGGALLATLAGDEDADFVHAASWHRTGETAAMRVDPPGVETRALVGSWMRGPRPPAAALAWWHDEEGGLIPSDLPADAGAAAFAEELALKLARDGRGVACGWPLVLTEARDEIPSRELRRALRPTLEPGRLGLLHAFRERPLRRVHALLDRAIWLAAAGAFEEALADLDAAVERGDVAPGAACLGAAWELGRGDREAALRRAEDDAFARAMLADSEAVGAGGDETAERAETLLLALRHRAPAERALLVATARALFSAEDPRRILVEAQSRE